MIGAPLTILALLAICVATSTREGREQAARKLARFDRPIWIASGILWAFLLFAP